MTSRAEMKLLGKVYGAEVYAALSKMPWTSVYQTKSPKIKHLREQGLVREAETQSPGGVFSVKIKGWELTELGRLTYCMSCDGDVKHG